MIDINPFDPLTLVAIALLNPATAIVGILLGQRATQWQKLIIAAMAASLSGFILYWIAAAVGLFKVHALGGEAGLIVMGLIVGLVWAAIGYVFFRAKPAAE